MLTILSIYAKVGWKIDKQIRIGASLNTNNCYYFLIVLPFYLRLPIFKP